ncbi:MAG: panthothenate kinase [Myxococcota bacterium]
MPHPLRVSIDGVFLLRPELKPHWDLTIFLAAPVEVTVARCARRDGSPADPHAPENQRYVLGQKIYVDECQPESKSDVVINNSDLGHPVLIRG